MAVAWTGACLACMVVVDIKTMCVAIVPILKTFDRIGWWLYPRRVHCTLLLVRIAATIIVVGVATRIVVLISIIVITVIWIEVVAAVVGIAIVVVVVVLVHGWTVVL